MLTPDGVEVKAVCVCVCVMLLLPFANVTEGPTPEELMWAHTIQYVCGGVRVSPLLRLKTHNFY